MGPYHVGLIPDGFRRWARSKGASQDKANEVTMREVEPIIDAIFEEDVNILSVYLLSKENLARTQGSLDPIIRGAIDLFSKSLPNVVNKWQCRVVHAGDISLLPLEYIKAMEPLCAASAHYTARTFYLCAGYNPRDELIHAVQRSLLTAKTIWECLWVPEEVDLVIRTSGEKRLSNFLPLQAGYAELIFLDKYFPDITAKDIKDAFATFIARTRRRGK
jgi:undecaprenyl diphosphate synthase